MNVFPGPNVVLVALICTLTTYLCHHQIYTARIPKGVGQSEADTVRDSSRILEVSVVRPLENRDSTDGEAVITSASTSRKWPYAFLVLSISVFAFGLWRYNRKRLKHTHFWRIILDAPPNQQPRTVLTIAGQFTTLAEDFVVGEKISIDFVLRTESDKYKMLRGFAKKGFPIMVANSEDPKTADRDLSKEPEISNISNWFVNEGSVEAVQFSDQTNTIRYKGDVIFNKSGNLSFHDPLKLLLEKIVIELPVAPRHVKFQIDMNKRVELLSYTVIALAVLQLFMLFL